RAAVMRAEHSHAIRPAKRDAGVAANPPDLVLQPAPVLAALGKPAVVDDSASHTSLCRGDERFADALVAYAKRRDIRRLRQFGEARIALAAGHRRIIGVDRKYRPLEADAIERGDQPSPDHRLLGGAD